MIKKNRRINLFNISQIEHRSTRSDKIKTTDINILLNRVRLSKNVELKKKIIYFSLTLLIIVFFGFFSLI